MLNLILEANMRDDPETAANACGMETNVGQKGPRRRITERVDEDFNLRS